jgi:phospholipid-translocating ATPase
MHTPFERIVKYAFQVPADCILLRTTESSGACFIRTDQLDGETDWKMRIAVSSTQKVRLDDELMQMTMSVYGTYFFYYFFA